MAAPKIMTRHFHYVSRSVRLTTCNRLVYLGLYPKCAESGAKTEEKLVTLEFWSGSEYWSVRVGLPLSQSESISGVIPILSENEAEVR